MPLASVVRVSCVVRSCVFSRLFCLRQICIHPLYLSGPFCWLGCVACKNCYRFDQFVSGGTLNVTPLNVTQSFILTLDFLQYCITQILFYIALSLVNIYLLAKL